MQRRSFLKTASWAALAQMGGLSPLRSMSAFAQSASGSDYKAIICLFMRGGNDSNNMIVPIGGSQYAAYAAARGSAAVGQGSLLPLGSTGFGLNPAFLHLQQAFNTGQAAVIANVGPLVQPTTPAQFRSSSAPLPTLLFGHDSQQETWESGGYNPSLQQSWAGLTADLIGSSYNSSNLPMVTLLGTAANFGRGQNSAPFTASTSANQTGFWCSEHLSCYPRAASAQQLINFNNNVSLIQADEQIYKQAYQYNNFYNSILAGAKGFATSFDGSNPLASQLYTVATMMKLHSAIGARRQIFLIDAGGFDTHAGQDQIQPTLYKQIDGAVDMFTRVTQEIGLYNNIALFTASDFSRTLSINTANGSDHAWGGHHFVLGGPVHGGKIYGTFPNLQLNGPDDLDGSGRFVPTTALSQYMATLAAWFGVPASALPAMFPGLSNFSAPTLAFV